VVETRPIQNNVNRLELGPIRAPCIGSMETLPIVGGHERAQLPEHFESPRPRDEEVERLRRGLKAWCATSDDSAQDEDCG
jgi:hypothetical protein